MGWLDSAQEVNMPAHARLRLPVRRSDQMVLMSDDGKDAVPGRAERLSEMLGLEPDNTRLWRPEELAAVFRHQMAAPVVFDLGGAN